LFDGEVEDYVVQVGDGVSVSGRVFLDSNVNTMPDTAERGIPGITIILHNLDNNSCQSMLTGTDGSYQFGGVAPGNYQVYEAFGEKIPSPTTCASTSARDLPGHRSTTTNTRPQFTVSTTNVTDQDFGDVRLPRLEPSHQSEILPGNVAFYAHTFTSSSTGQVTFVTRATGNITVGWSNQLYRDKDCDGKLNAKEGVAPISSSTNVSTGERICLINKVYAPANAAPRDRYQQEIIARFDFNNAIAGSVDLKVNDLTIVTQKQATANPTLPETGSSALELLKTVANITQGTAETYELNQAAPGDRLQYRIYYRNTGTGPITELHIDDNAPAFTGSPSAATCVDTPSGLTCSPTITGEEIDWRFTGILSGGSSGSVSYQVVVDQ